MKFLALIFLSFTAHSEIKNLECVALLNQTEVVLDIIHDTEDFRQNPFLINSSIVVKTSSQEQILDVKTFDSERHVVEFTSSTVLANIKDTPYRIKEIFLYDKYLELDQDDFFFGRFENSSGGEGKYLSNFSQFGGDKMIIFKCR